MTEFLILFGFAAGVSLLFGVVALIVRLNKSKATGVFWELLEWFLWLVAGLLLLFTATAGFYLLMAAVDYLTK